MKASVALTAEGDGLLGKRIKYEKGLNVTTRPKSLDPKK